MSVDNLITPESFHKFHVHKRLWLDELKEFDQEE